MLSILRLHDTLYLQGKCKAETIFLEKKIPIERIINMRPNRVDKLISFIPWFVIGFIAFTFLTFLVVKLIMRFKN